METGGGAADAGASSSSNHVDPEPQEAPQTGDEDEVAEVDPEGRYYRWASAADTSSSCYGWPGPWRPSILAACTAQSMTEW